MGYEARALTWEQREARHARKARVVFDELKRRYDENPGAFVRDVLAKIHDRKERQKVMLGVGLIDYIED